ncbi:hypothetical protein GCM10018962_21340 [Dactylosporangium matsuzakiense]|uniref:Uncharacterized protein n=1 Tax=Dactylosporangium matsuzakiense TaxID=53360 RepID=A0A9W6NRK8_9ACTN|nr:hypothetical protein GCM10017581_091420 [Dactylosporangium matsuzakiense]
MRCAFTLALDLVLDVKRPPQRLMGECGGRVLGMGLYFVEWLPLRNVAATVVSAVRAVWLSGSCTLGRSSGAAIGGKVQVAARHVPRPSRPGRSGVAQLERADVGGHRPGLDGSQ